MLLRPVIVVANLKYISTTTNNILIGKLVFSQGIVYPLPKYSKLLTSIGAFNKNECLQRP